MKLGARLKQYFWNRPYNQIVYLAFVPLIVLSILVPGFIVLSLTQEQIYRNTNISVNDTLTQSSGYLNERLEDILNSFVAMENSTDMLLLINRMNTPQFDKVGAVHYINSSRTVDLWFRSYPEILDSVIVDFNDGKFRMYRNENIPAEITFDYSRWKRQYPAPGHQWSGVQPDRIFVVTTQNEQKTRLPVASLFRLYGDENKSFHGGIVLNIKRSFFEEVLSRPAISENGYLVLAGGGTNLMCKEVESRYMLSDASLAELAIAPDIDRAQTILSATGEPMITYSRKLAVNGWTLILTIPRSELFSEVNHIKQLLIFTVILLGVLGLVVANGISSAITRPIKKLTGEVGKAQSGKEADFLTKEIQEVSLLGEMINRLVQSEKQLLSQVKSEQIAKREAELSLLQAQIRPHFLYNTLYSAQQLCAMGESEIASNMLRELSTFFRIGLSGGNEVITIEDEITHVCSYLYIQQLKYSDNFDYTIAIDPEIMQFRILKLTLQPLVENAIYHGIKCKRGKSSISLKGYRKNNRIVLEVEDTGAGMTPERLEQVLQDLQCPKRKSGAGFGLRNVYERIAIHYHGMAAFSVESTLGQGTRITISIPDSVAQQQENENV